MFVNYIVILVSGTVIDVAKDFTALMIIAKFDDIFSHGIKDEKAKKICTESMYENIFKIETTTSIDALGESNMKLDEDPVFDLIKLNHRLKNCPRDYPSVIEKLKEVILKGLSQN